MPTVKPKRKSVRKRAAKPPLPPAARLADAALKQLAKTPWSELSLAATAMAAKVPMSELMGLCGSKPALFELILARFGERVAQIYVAEDGSAHDRLFEVAMSWFEALTPHKKAVASLYDSLRRDPFTVLAARSGIIAAAGWLLVLAEADTGTALPLRALALAAALARAVPVWLVDDADLTKTMARLDLDIRRGETVVGRFERQE